MKWEPGSYRCTAAGCEWSLPGEHKRPPDLPDGQPDRVTMPAPSFTPCPACGSTGSTLPVVTYTSPRGERYPYAVTAVVDTPEGLRVHGLLRTALATHGRVVPADSVTEAP